MSSKAFSGIIIIFAFFVFLPLVAQGASFEDIVINEIAWMGTNVSYNDEWIELYNNTDSSINLDSWVLKAEDGTPEINLAGTVPAAGFYLLERTNDETVPGISADLIYKGALENKGEYLKLYDNFGNLINEVNCSEGWLAGNNETKQTMERTKSTEDGPLQGWQTSQHPGGTPAAENSVVEARPQQPAETEEPGKAGPRPAEEKVEKLDEVGSRVTEEKSYPAGIIFNEILPSPEGPDPENEWTVPTNEHFLCL